MRPRLVFVLLMFVVRVYAQADVAPPSAVMKQILDRLDALEKQNQQLIEDVHALRQEVAAARSTTPSSALEAKKPDQPTLDERLSVEERRTAEQAQTKVEAGQKFPIQLTGMLLFNAFANSSSTASEYSGNYNLITGPNRDGATVRQSILGLNFQGPRLPGDGRVNGLITMDFYGGTSDPEYMRLRLRRADVSFDWGNRSFTFGQDKPLISPYQPDSLAEVGIPPLAGAGNLWLWLPQARYEERIHLGTRSGFTGQIALLQTEESYSVQNVESYTNTKEPLANTLEKARPALEGRFAFWHKFDDTKRFEFAPGFHVSTTHVGGTSIGSHIASFDWLVVPSSHLRFNGTFFKGQNVASLGALGNGFAISPDGIIRPVTSTGGWAQLAFPITSRLTLNLFSGIENDHSPYLSAAALVHNWTYASNLMYHIGPNVVISAEALQMRARSMADAGIVQNHYDLAIGYLF